ncbi:MAG: hypothetical protein GY804_07100 [Alphaproteobacteria bacterium]|nr:hypothetical protein [Alphaproteobacteria bacterium]
MKKLLLSTIAFSTAFSVSVHAETSNQEFGAINKIASLCKTFKSSGLKMAVVFSSSTSKSVNDKNSLIGYAKSSNLKAKEVEMANIASTDANLVILAEGLTPQDQAKVKSTLKGKPVITASTDLSCVESGKCMLGVNVGSVVKLLVDSKVYTASGLKFDPAFEFMVKQI